jgi:ATP-binding cassette, subfamily B, bacterial PglK
MTIPFENSGRPISTREVVGFLLQNIGRREVTKLLAVVIAMSLMDMAGVAIIFPFLTLVTQPDYADRLLLRFGLGPYPHSAVVTFSGVLLAALYAAKTVLQAAMLRKQANTLARFTAATTNDIVARVLAARYALFQQMAASEVGGTAYSCTVHSTLTVTALIQATNEALVLVLLMLGFLFFEPMLALGAILFAVIAAGLLYQIVIRRSAEIGAAQSNVESVRYRLLFSLSSAIRDIKIMGLDSLFDKRSRQVSAEYAELAGRNSYNIGLPRLLIEFFAVIAIIGIALSVVLMQMSPEHAGPLLGLIAVGTVRAVPGFYRLFSSVSAFRASQPLVARLMALRRKLIEAEVVRVDDTLTFERSIELRNVSFRYDDRHVLRDISLTLNRGESIGIVGASGAGKTTLLDIFTGLQPATSGTFLADDVPFNPVASQALHRMIGYVPQAIALFDDTLAFNVSFDKSAQVERVMQMLTMAHLKEFVESLPDGVNTRVGENGLRLSGGQRQRIGIARALFREPRILVFDEATSALDTMSERALTEEIEQLHGKISVVIVAHRLSTVMACDRIYVLANGAVESHGTHAELLTRSATYQKLYAQQVASQVAA